MDVLFFLKRRTEFICRFYDTAAESFQETIRKIEAGEAPFEPPYSEDGEPPFLEEWIEADAALEMLGRACVSILSASLNLYFATWEKELGVTWVEGERERAFKKGFLRGYQKCFAEVLKLSWADCPARLDVVEQIILARNRDQHPETIATMRVTHAHADRRKYPQLFFVSEAEQRAFTDPEWAAISWINPAVHVSRDMLLAAIREVEMLAEWLDALITVARFGGQSMQDDRDALQAKAAKLFEFSGCHDPALLAEQFSGHYRYPGDINAGLVVSYKGQRVKAVISRNPGTSSVRLDSDDGSTTVSAANCDSFEVLSDAEPHRLVRLLRIADVVLEFGIDPGTELEFLRALLKSADVGERLSPPMQPS